MTTAHIAKFSGGVIHITTGGGSHPETKVTYTASSGLSPWSGNIVGTLEGYMIPNVSDVQTVDIGNTVTEIYNDAFDGCSGLTSVTIPDSVESISGYAFYNCTSLSSITFPSSVESFSEGIIENCDNLHTLNFPGRSVDDAEQLAQMYGITRNPTGDGDYLEYVFPDGTYTVVAEDEGDGYYSWVVQ